MTREQAIKILDRYDLNFYDIEGNPIPPQDLAEAFDMAIEALRQEPICCKDCKHKEWFETGKIYCCELQDKPAEVKDMDYCSWGEKCDEALDGGDEE